MSVELSIIVPVYNERDYIGDCLDSIIKNDFGFDYELIVADGGSVDGTREILSEYQEKHDNILLLDNPKKLQVYALNLMLEKAVGKYIVRCDAHAVYPSDYFSSLVRYLQLNDDVGNVGRGVKTCPARKGGLTSEAIAINLSSKFGVGVSHRTTNRESDVDTLLFGAWKAALFDEVGCFNPRYVRGQDYEHNVRIRKSGKRIVLVEGDPISYYGRDSYYKLFNMMKQYAAVKPRIFSDYGILPSYRSVVPFFFWLFVILSAIAFPVLATIGLSLYIFACFIFAFYEGASRDRLRLWPFIFLGYMVQHLGHATGFLLGVIHALRNKDVSWSGTR